MGVEVSKHHLVSSMSKKRSNKSQCGPPKVGLERQNLRRVIIGEYVAIRVPVWDEVVVVVG